MNQHEGTRAVSEQVTIVPVMYRVEEAAEALRLSRARIYELIRSGRLETVCEGRARRVPAEAIAEYVALLRREAAA